MNWRPWVYGRLCEPSVAALVPNSSVLSGGSLTLVPSARPFIIYRLNGETPALKDGFETIRTTNFCEVWVYDEPGSYDRIDEIIDAVKSEMVGMIVATGACACEWIGNSRELADDVFKAIVRNATFKLIGGP